MTTALYGISFFIFISSFFIYGMDNEVVKLKKGMVFLDREYYFFSHRQKAYYSNEVLKIHVKNTIKKISDYKIENKYIEFSNKNKFVSAYYLYRLFVFLNKKKKNKINIKGMNKLRRLVKEVLPFYIPNQEFYEKEIEKLRCNEHEMKAPFVYKIVYGDGRILKDGFIMGCESDNLLIKYKSLQQDYEKLKKIVYVNRRRCCCKVCFVQ